MKKLFQAIRKQDLDTVKGLIASKPELVFSTAKQPPKMDDGQSPLQVALKAGNLDIADFLLDSGADVGFMEADTCCNPWRAPVLHDAINAAVMSCRWNVNSEEDGLEVFGTEEEANRAFGILKRMLDLGADVSAVDSFGNSGVWRLCLQARQILPSFDRAENRLEIDRVLTPELTADLSRIFILLSEHGAESSKELLKFFKDEPLEYFIRLMTKN